MILRRSPRALQTTKESIPQKNWLIIPGLETIKNYIKSKFNLEVQKIWLSKSDVIHRFGQLKKILLA